MRVLLCESRVPYDCAMYGFAYGGLFERDEKNYLSSYFALDIAQQLPTFAFNYNLFGREKIKMNLDIQDYIRSFEALFETDELNVALQLPMDFVAGALFFSSEEVARTAVWVGANCLSNCPSQFTVVIVGPFDMKIAATSVQKYLGSIPRAVCNTFPLAKSGLKKLRINFPEKAVRHNIHHDLSFKEVYICIPVKMDKEKQDVDEVLIEYLKAIVEQKIKILLRCEMGEVYSVSAEAVFDGKVYSSPGNEEAFLRLRFCHDSDTLLIDRALQLIEDLPNALSEADLACLPSYLEQAKFSSASILAEVVQAYHAKQYNGHLEEIILERRKMLQELSRFNHDLQFWKSIFKRMMPYQCTRRHVCVVFHEAGKESEPEDVAEYVDDGVSFEEYLDDEQSDEDSDTIHIIPYDSEEEDEEESVGDSDEEGSDTIPDDSEEEDEEESDGDSDEEGSDIIPDDSEEEHENKSD